MPLPFQFKYLLFKSANTSLTLDTVLLGSLYSRYKNFDWRPSVTFSGRRAVSSVLALNAEAFLQAEIKRSTEERLARTVGMKSGTLLQLSKSIAIIPSISIINERGRTVAKYVGELPASVEGMEFRTSRWRFPLSFDLLFSINRRWEIWLNTNYYRLNYEENYSSLTTFLTTIYYF